MNLDDYIIMYRDKARGNWMLLWDAVCVAFLFAVPIFVLSIGGSF